MAGMAFGQVELYHRNFVDSLLGLGPLQLYSFHLFLQVHNMGKQRGELDL